MQTIQIIATIGPSCTTQEIIGKMIDAGMSLARLNFSWGTHEEHAHFVAMVREEASRRGIAIPIIQDLSGPRIQETNGHTFDVSASVITKKDRDDLVFAVANKPEYIAMSFVRSAEDIRALRSLLAQLDIHAKIIAKIERKEALEKIDEIIAEANGIMIARGDLGESIPFETVPFVKKDILKKCIYAQTPAVVATEMLTSMSEDEDPSRADITDISQAVVDGASATMLSNETAIGGFPVEVVAVMRKVVDTALEHTQYPSVMRF